MSYLLWWGVVDITLREAIACTYDRELVDGDREYKRGQLKKKMKELEIIKGHLNKSKPTAISKAPKPSQTNP